MNNKLPLALLSVTALSLLTACGVIKNLFPDKEKDYQFTTEIPALVLPPDLSRDSSSSPSNPSKTNTFVQTENLTASTIPSATEQTVETAAPTPTATESTVIADTSASTVIEKASSTSKHDIIPVELITAADGSKQLRLSSAFEPAWRAIDKALSRKSIEVTLRDKTDKSFKLHYDPDEKKLEDGSFWHEALFMFSGFQNNEQELVVKLAEHSTEQTDVLVLDKEQKPTMDANAMSLLKLLQDTIKADFAK